MNLEARKIEFIQEFLKVQSEDVISRLEEILRKGDNTFDERIVEPMTEEELNKRIDQSESDFRNNRFKSSSELLSKYE
jgi:low affinity Fe/Cu permease